MKWVTGVLVVSVGLLAYAATADGQRFLISTAAEIPPITVMLNWASTVPR